MFAYNYAAVLTRGYSVMRSRVDDRATLFGFAFVFALFWTEYFRIGVIPRLDPLFGSSDGTEADS